MSTAPGRRHRATPKTSPEIETVLEAAAISVDCVIAVTDKIYGRRQKTDFA
jgi:hypothetical protein